MATNRVIDGLVRDLEPVRTVGSGRPWLLLWLMLAWMVVLGLTVATGSFRAGVAEQLTGSWRLALECGLGSALGVVSMGAALGLGIPGGLQPRPALAAVGILVGGWLLLCVVGLFWPALPPTMLGKRPHCSLETFLFAALPLLLALGMVRRRIFLRPGLGGLLLGVAAGSIPALVMQWACMYGAQHALVHHLGPAALVALAGAVLGVRLLPRP